MTYVGLLVVLGMAAYAVPIKPDLQKILKQSQRPKYFEPARAGWNGPEMVRPQDASPNPIYEAYGPASTVRMIRASLVAAVMPNPAAIALIGALIVLLRFTRQRRLRRENTVVVPIRSVSPVQEQRAA